MNIEYACDNISGLTTKMRVTNVTPMLFDLNHHPNSIQCNFNVEQLQAKNKRTSLEMAGCCMLRHIRTCGYASL